MVDIFYMELLYDGIALWFDFPGHFNDFNDFCMNCWLCKSDYVLKNLCIGTCLDDASFLCKLLKKNVSIEVVFYYLYHWSNILIRLSVVWLLYMTSCILNVLEKCPKSAIHSFNCQVMKIYEVFNSFRECLNVTAQIFVVHWVTALLQHHQVVNMILMVSCKRHTIVVVFVFIFMVCFFIDIYCVTDFMNERK